MAHVRAQISVFKKKVTMVHMNAPTMFLAETTMTKMTTAMKENIEKAKNRRVRSGRTGKFVQKAA